MLSRALALLENATVWLACLALFVMGAIVTGSVVGRTAFNAPIPDDLLVVGLLMVCVVVLPLAYIERDDGHIVVTVIANLLPKRIQAFLSAIGRLLFGTFLGVMGYMLALKVPSELAQGLYYDGQLEVPTWPMKMVFAFGVFVFLIRLSINFVLNLAVAFGLAEPPTPGGHAMLPEE